MSISKAVCCVMICMARAHLFSDEDLFKLDWCFAGNQSEDENLPEPKEASSGGLISAFSSQFPAIRALQPALPNAQRVLHMGFGIRNVVATLLLFIPKEARLMGVDLDDNYPEGIGHIPQQNFEALCCSSKCTRCKTQLCKSFGIPPPELATWTISIGQMQKFEYLQYRILRGPIYDVMFVGCVADMQTSDIEILLQLMSHNAVAVFYYGSQSKQAMYHISVYNNGSAWGLSSCNLLTDVGFWSSGKMCASFPPPKEKTNGTVVQPDPFDQRAVCEHVERSWSLLWKRRFNDSEFMHSRYNPFMDRSEQEDLVEEYDDDDVGDEYKRMTRVTRAAPYFISLLAFGAFAWILLICMSKYCPRRRGWAHWSVWRQSNSHSDAVELDPYLNFETDAENEQSQKAALI